MLTVINSCGEEIDFAAAVAIMDDEIREQVHANLSPCTEQEFFTAYCKAHKAAFGTEFECEKRNSVY